MHRNPPFTLLWALPCLLALPGCGDVAAMSLEVGPPRESFQPNGAFPGYTLFAPLRSTTTYLVDMEGEPVHTWPSEFKGNAVYLLDDGSILRSTSVKDPPVFEGGGQSGRLERTSWDGELLWEYVYATEDHLQHHDLEPLTNGNVLFLAWERKTRDEALAAGRDADLVEWDTFWPDKIVEVRPIPPDGGEVVWEWHAWDHLVQNRDPAKPHYGEPAEHPHRIDVNGDRRPEEDQPTPEEEQAEIAMLEELGYAGDGDEEDAPEEAAPEESQEEESEEDARRRRRTADWMHGNAVAHHPELDLIAISVRRFHEIWVIDHSTTTEEARGSQGGLYGKGGDLLYRWGNPAAYGMGTWEDRMLFGQHNVQWIPAGYLGAGNFIVYNNGHERDDRPWSSLDEWRMPLDERGRIVREEGKPFGPAEPLWTYLGDPPENFFSSFISGVQRLPNGNTLACVGQSGTFVEVTPDGEVVWEFENPHGMEKADPDDPITNQMVNRTAVFRCTRVAPDHPGLSRLQL